MINISSYNFQFFQNMLTYTWISLFVKYPCATPPHHTHVRSLQFRTLLIDNDYSSAAKCRRADLSDRPGFRDFSRFLAALDELVPRRGLNRTAIRIVSSYLSLPIREKEREREEEKYRGLQADCQREFLLFWEYPRSGIRGRFQPPLDGRELSK